MKVTFLGTGTSVGVPMIGCDCATCISEDPRDKRLRTSLLVELEDLTFVIDTGPDFRAQMLQHKVQHLDAVLFTHEHRDHTAGLDDIRPFNFVSDQALEVFATERVQEELKQQFQYIFETHTFKGLPQVNLKSFSKETFEIKGHKILPIEVLHYKLPISGFRFHDFTYITDLKTISESEKEKIKGSKILVLNALRFEEHRTHLTVDEAVALANSLEVPEVYFTHFSHQIGTHKAVEAQLPEHIKMAYDGLVLDC